MRTFAGMGNIRQQVALTDARFYAYHGYYAEEQVLGNEFTVDIHVAFDRKGDAASEDLGHTVNYEQLYRIAEAAMQHPRKLLETVVETMLEQVKDEFPFLSDIEVAITKHHPPFGGDRAKARVALQWKAPN